MGQPKYDIIEFNQQLYSQPFKSYMFFGNPELLQRNLHADLNTLIKNVKARQDQYLTILQYNKNLISNLTQIQHIPFFSDQLNKHKTFFISSETAHNNMAEQQLAIKEKYQCVTSGQVSRVISRVLEICQMSVDKGKYMDGALSQKFGQFKNGLMDKLNESGKINIQCMLDSIIDYSVGKDKKEIQRLEEIIKILMLGDFQKLAQIYNPPRQPSPKKVQPSPTLFVQQKPAKKQHIMTSSQSPQKNKSPQKAHQLQLKNIEKTKKKKAKVIKQLLTNMYSLLDLSKQQFNQDFNYVHNPEQKKKKLYEQIFSRNKFNYQQIIQFQSKKVQFQEKVKQFKAMMELQSNKIQQALVILVNKPIQPKLSQQKVVKTNEKKQTKSDAEQNQPQDQVLPERVSRVFRRRDKKQPPKAQSPRFIKETTFTCMQSTQQGFQHIKFDIRNEQVFTRSNRARLPQIPGRSSLDNRYQTKNISHLAQKKQQKRINIMKNIQIGTSNNTNLVKNSITTKIQQQNKKSPRERSLGEQIFDNISNINMNANGLNGLDYTFYVRKKVSKFYETKNNFIM